MRNLTLRKTTVPIKIFILNFKAKKYSILLHIGFDKFNYKIAKLFEE